MAVLPHPLFLELILDRVLSFFPAMGDQPNGFRVELVNYLTGHIIEFYPRDA